MKKLFLFPLLIFYFGLSSAQVIGFHENFEPPSLDDSLISTQTNPPVKDWGINSRLFHTTASTRSDSCQVKAGATQYLTSISFSTIGYTYVVLTFSQIAKIDFLDIATIEVSNDNGVTWVQLTAAQYLGTGQFGANGNRFACNSYGSLWQPSNPPALPQNTWWRTETFDISQLVGNYSDVKIRFRLSDGGQVGPTNNAGWYLDNVKVTLAPSELIPPVITLVPPVISGIVWSVGPFNIKAKISDQSGIDTAYIVYSINNGPYDTAGMIDLPLDTMMGVIPTVNDSDVVCWWVEAFDASLAHNWAREPVSSCNQFTAYAGITFPFYDNFDVNLGLWTPSYGGTNQSTTWQLGTPSYGNTNSAHSPPNAWDVNLTTTYYDNAYCILTSPVFDFSNAVNAKLTFWRNNDTETSYDGTRLEYTTNGTNWQILGSLNDPLGENWYTNSIYSTNQPAWAGNSNGWLKCKYKLSVLNNVVGQVRFRYIFNSDGSQTYSGFSIDDFSIVLPAPQEAALTQVSSPNSGCGLGNETITITILNEGMTAINGGLTASYKKAPWAPAVTETVPGTIQPGSTLTYTFTTPVNLSATGQDSLFNIKVWVTLANDPNHGDDTLIRQVVSKFIPAPPGVTSVLIPYGTSTTITATSPSPISWYDAPTGGNLIGSGSNFTTPILYATTVYYPQANGANGCIGPRAADTVYVGQPPPYDGACLLLVAPNTGFNLGSSMIVRTRIRNYGTQPATGFQMSYKINSLPPVTETFTATLQPGDTTTYTFTTPANLSAYATYQFKSWLDIPGDNNHQNDTVTKTVINNMFTYCESYATSNGYDDIGNVTISNLNWGNPLPYLNNPAANQTYNNYTTTAPSILLTKGQTYNISVSAIYLGSFYTCHCKVFVDWNYDGQFDPATETAFTGGPTTTTNGVMAGTITVPVTAAIGPTRFRVVLVETSSPSSITPCTTYTWGETEDYTALIMPQLAKDAGITNIQTPATTYPQGYSSPVSVIMKNFGTDPITSVVVGYIIDNNPPVTQTWTGNLATNATTNVTFPAITWPTGFHSFCAYTALVSDSNSFNDTICRTIQGVPVDTLPYYDNFDGAIQFFPTTTSGTSWIHGAPIAPNWPHPPVSLPNVWATNLNMNSYTANASCYLTTQIFDFSNAINARISFWYNCNMPTTGDGAQVQYSTDGGSTWNVLGSVNDPLGINWFNSTITTLGAAWAGNSNGWMKATYLLSNFNFTPTMRFRFYFYSNTSSQTYGFAIDNFAITIPYPHDAGVDLVYAPNGINDEGTMLTVDVRLNNNGMNNLTSTPIYYQINNNPIVSETWNGNLSPGDSTHYVFTTPFATPAGTYTLKAFTGLPNDGDHMNDTVTVELFGIPILIPYFYDDMDSAVCYFYTTGSLWQKGSPASPVINAPYSPPNSWKTVLNSVYPHASAQYLYSPKFDFSIVGMDTLKFYHWVHTHSNDWGRVEYLANDGTWKKLGYINDPNATNWYNVPNGWSMVDSNYIYSNYDLKITIDYAIPTQFRWTFSPASFNNTTYNGWAVDNVELTFPRIQIDASTIQVLQPTGTNTYGQDIVVSAVIKNTGWDTLMNVPVKYMINGITVGYKVNPGVLLPDATATVTFDPLPSPMQDYKLCVYTDVNFDTYLFNDSVCEYITVVPPPFDLTMIELLQPASQTNYGDSATVEVMIKNLGQNPVSEVPLVYTVQDTFKVVQETWYGSQALQTGESTTYTFNTRYYFPNFGYYYLCVYTDLSSDGYRINDTICRRLENKWLDIFENVQSSFGLSQNIPNPADQNTLIVCMLPGKGEIQLEVINQLGQCVISRREKTNGGEHSFELNTTGLPSGMYYYFVTYGETRLAKKMIIEH